MRLGSPDLRAASAWAWSGDFSRFVVPLRFGANVELIENMPDMSGGTGSPTAQRGYYFAARWGCAPVTLDAFRLLANS
jgi:predicted phage gp36 major capsid-like protein